MPDFIKTAVRLGLAVLLLARTLQSAEDGCSVDADCENSGTCDRLGVATDHSEIFSSCLCAPGFTGRNCDDTCPIKCQNGGQCVVESDEHGGLEIEYTCRCPEMFDGPLCSINSTLEGEPIEGQPESSSLTGGAIFGITMASLVGLVALIMLVVHLKKKEALSCTTSSETIDTTSGKPTLEKTEEGLEFTQEVTMNTDVSIS